MATGSGALPPELDQRHWRQTGARVLESGPPELPSRLTHQMWIPLCCWAGECCGVVAFMYFTPDHEDGHMRAMTILVPYTREDGRWVAPQGNTFGGYSSNNGFDPLSDPDDRRHLDGSTMTYGMFSPRDSHQPGRRQHCLRPRLTRGEVPSRYPRRPAGLPCPALALRHLPRVRGKARPLRRRRIRQRGQASRCPSVPAPDAPAPPAAQRRYLSEPARDGGARHGAAG